MRVAVLHDHLRFIGGGERVVLTLARALDADLYVTDLDAALPQRAGMAEVRVTEIARVPTKPPLRQDRQAKAFGDLELPAYDAYVLSGNWTVFAAPRLRPNLWYCHTPVRVFYDLREAFLGSLPPLSRWAARRWIERRRPQYEEAVTAVERIVANSRNVASRIERYLERTADVVYPPVDTARYRFRRVGDTWLAVTRLSHEKRLDLLVDVFRRLPEERIVVVGGPQMGADPDRFIRSLRPPDNVEFRGEIPEPELLELYATCRGLVATSMDEDFGLTPVEAMASGKVVIATDEGGYRETVIPGTTGWLVPATPDAFARRVSGASTEELEAMRPACERRARDFDSSVFVSQMRRILGHRIESGSE
ncbi:MAG TPA: glycosyltransferase [Thermoplasmata archaeon]|nr:glycosyltransferase [Thermoplasmata archaeon]